MKTFSNTTQKNIMSVLVGPLAVIPAMLLMGLLTVFVFPEQSNHIKWGDLFTFFGLVITLIAYVLTVIVALPIILILQKFNAFTLLSIMVTALLICGILCMVVSADLSAFLFFSYFAISVALACWCIHKWL